MLSCLDPQNPHSLVVLRGLVISRQDRGLNMALALEMDARNILEAFLEHAKAK
jgi:hypothetical protein